MRSAWGILGLGLLVGCGGEPGWPRVQVDSPAAEHGDYTRWTFDRTGHYERESLRSDGYGRQRARRCRGTADLPRIEPLFEAVETLDLGPDPGPYEASLEQRGLPLGPSRHGPSLSYWDSDQEPQFPQEPDGFAAFDALADQYAAFEAYGRERCW